MRRLRLAFGAAALLVSGCAHEPPPKAPVAEEAIVNAPAAANAKPIPEIDPNKPLVHANEVNSMNNRPNCYRSGRRSTVCK